MTIWFTSDQHFNHINAIKYCNRPFANVDEMNKALIGSWNKVVKPDDTVYHLGDFTLGGIDVAQKFLEQLNGTLLVLLNPHHHDKRWILSPINRDERFDILPGIWIMEANDIGNTMPIILCHYPFEVWDRKHYGAIHFHGHSHGKLHKVIGRLDVGVDNAYKLLGQYQPFSLTDAIEFAKEA